MRKKTTRYSLKIFLSLTLFLAVVVVMAMVTVRTRARPQWQQKVDDWVLEEAGAADEVEFLVVLKDQADLGRISDRLSKAEKGAAVYDSLTDVALRSQASLIPDLKAAGADYRPFWISNMIWVRGDRTLVESLAGRPDVAHIAANPAVKLDLLPVQATAYSSAQGSAEEWNNIAKVQAPNVWAEGIDGSGVVIGGQDTGYDWQHPALMNQYRGWDGQSASHTYNWYDAIHEDNPNTLPGNPCGFDSPQPCDDQGHGTHTMGTMVGQDGAENQIGMAPGAQWIACRNMEQGWGTPATYAECYQWFVAPYPQDGDPFSDGDPTKAPLVINNSWSCPAGEGCVDPEVLRDVVNNVRAAGILTVHSAGNSGLTCGTIDEPAAMYDASFSVGATNSSDVIADFSSRGPSLQDDVPITKPEISAPGVYVRSSIPGDAYGIKSGTSMAAPHVAGLAALLISARPDLAGKVDLLETLIQNSAMHLVTDQGCGDDGPQSVPNNVYGWGRIDAYSAYEAAVALPTPIPTPTPSVFIPTWFSP